MTAVGMSYGGRSAPTATPGSYPEVRDQPGVDSSRRVFSAALAFFVLVAVARVIVVLAPPLAVLPMAKIAALVLAITGYAAFRRADVQRTYRTTTARAFGVLVVLAVLSAPFALWRGGAVSGLQGVFMPVVFLFALGSVGLVNPRTRQLCTAALVLGVGADALVVLSGRTLVEGRAMIGGGYDPNDSAALLVATIPLALLLATQRGILRKVVFTGIALLSVAAVVKTGSRGGLVGLVAMFIALIAVARGRQRFTYLAVAVVGSALFSVLARDRLGARFATVLEVKSDYNMYEEDGRIAVWKRGIGYMVQNPLLGVGFNNFTIAEGKISSKAADITRVKGIRYTAAHNAYVQVGAEVGVFGLAAFLTMLGSAAAGCWRVARRQGVAGTFPEVAWARAAFVALVGLSVSAIFLSLAYHAMLVFIVTLCTGVIVSAARTGEQAAGGGWASGPVLTAITSGWRSRRTVTPRGTRAVAARPRQRTRGWRSA